MGENPTSFFFESDIIWNMILPILLVIFSNCVYNICTKSTPDNVNPFATLMITYLVALILTAILFVFLVKPSNLMFELSKINWTSIVLGIALVGLEVGYILVYRAGWKVSTASVVANIGLACALLFVGFLLYKENISLRQIIGLIICMFGLILISG